MKTFLKSNVKYEGTFELDDRTSKVVALDNGMVFNMSIIDDVDQDLEMEIVSEIPRNVLMDGILHVLEHSLCDLDRLMNISKRGVGVNVSTMNSNLCGNIISPTLRVPFDHSKTFNVGTKDEKFKEDLRVIDGVFKDLIINTKTKPLDFEKFKREMSIVENELKGGNFNSYACESEKILNMLRMKKYNKQKAPREMCYNTFASGTYSLFKEYLDKYGMADVSKVKLYLFSPKNTTFWITIPTKITEHFNLNTTKKQLDFIVKSFKGTIDAIMLENAVDSLPDNSDKIREFYTNLTKSKDLTTVKHRQYDEVEMDYKCSENSKAICIDIFNKDMLKEIGEYTLDNIFKRNLSIPSDMISSISSRLTLYVRETIGSVYHIGGRPVIINNSEKELFSSTVLRMMIDVTAMSEEVRLKLLKGLKKKVKEIINDLIVDEEELGNYVNHRLLRLCNDTAVANNIFNRIGRMLKLGYKLNEKTILGLIESTATTDIEAVKEYMRTLDTIEVTLI